MKSYIIPTTESVAFYAGSICQTSAGSSDPVNVTGPNITGGGQSLGGGDPD